MDEILKLDKLDIGYDKKVVNNISLTIGEKELIAVLSPNNCGKTTLIKTLSGVIRPKDGLIYFNGEQLTKKTFKQYIRKIGVVFEDINNQYICEKVDDELKFPLIHLAYKYPEIKDRVKEVAHFLDIEDKLDKNIKDLTLLDKAKVSIGVAIMHKPKVLIVDDIFKSLIAKDREIVMDIFKLLIVNHDMSVLFTTSDLNDCIGLNDIYVIGDKKVILKGSYDEILKKDNELSKAGIEIPIMIDLSRKLQFYNLIDDIYYDVDKVVDALWK
jgi:energy-coupling factor transporter ATP-binding protein EcfA2